MLIWRNIFSYVVFIFIRLLYFSLISASHIECPGKDVNEIRQQAQQYEISFLFYHVSWSDDSQIARQAYDQIAFIYREKIYFATIDCYHLTCNCSKTHSSSHGSGTPNKWPTLIIQYGQRIHLQYNGEWSLTALHSFITNLQLPLERLHTRKELKEMSMERDAVVLGVFPDLSQPEFRKFVSASVKWLESDPVSTFRFATAFGKSMNIILDKVNNSNQTQSQILLITSKDIIRFSNDWSVNNIISWLKSKFIQSVNTFYGYNSPKNLATQLNLSPVLAVIANDYFYEYMHNLTNPGFSIKDPCSINSLQRDMFVLEELGYVRNMLNKIKLSNPHNCYAKEYLSIWNLQNYYSLNTYLKRRMCLLSDNCDNNDVLEFSIKQLTKCIQTKFNFQRGKIAAAKYIKKFVDTNWIDFKSNQNQSLSVVILDEAKYMDFLQNLGIKETNVNNFVTMIIADRLKENIFLTQDIFSYETLQHFVRGYYNKSLTAYKAISYFKRKSEAPISKVFVENVNSETFMKQIEESNLTTILLLSSPQCTFSALVSQALIQLSALLDDSSGIQIIRINTQLNELRWEFQIDRTPTLIVFPRGRSADSRVFPMHLKVNVRNILSFALAQMEPLDQLKALLSCCKRQTLHSLRMRKCLQYIKTVVEHQKSDNMKGQKVGENAIYADQIVEWSDVNWQLKTIYPLN